MMRSLICGCLILASVGAGDATEAGACPAGSKDPSCHSSDDQEILLQSRARHEDQEEEQELDEDLASETSEAAAAAAEVWGSMDIDPEVKCQNGFCQRDEEDCTEDTRITSKEDCQAAAAALGLKINPYSNNQRRKQQLLNINHAGHIPAGCSTHKNCGKPQSAFKDYNKKGCDLMFNKNSAGRNKCEAPYKCAYAAICKQGAPPAPPPAPPTQAPAPAEQWSGIIAGYYLETYVDCDACYSEAEAKAKCIENPQCNGITKQTQRGPSDKKVRCGCDSLWSLRRGTDPKKQNNNVQAGWSNPWTQLLFRNCNGAQTQCAARPWACKNLVGCDN